MPGWVLVVMGGLLLVGCAGGTGTEVESEVLEGPATDPEDPTILMRPFTADEIRTAWAPGLELTIEYRTPDRTHLERWTVLTADAEGAEIEYAILDDDGRADETRVERSGWIDLRNHASFPAASARREEVTRETALGSLDGWLYTVRDEAAGNVTEFFFARSLPGAPAHMRVIHGETVVMEFTQIERTKPQG